MACHGGRKNTVRVVGVGAALLRYGGLVHGAGGVQHVEGVYHAAIKEAWRVYSLQLLIVLRVWPGRRRRARAVEQGRSAVGCG